MSLEWGNGKAKIASTLAETSYHVSPIVATGLSADLSHEAGGLQRLICKIASQAPRSCPWNAASRLLSHAESTGILFFGREAGRRVVTISSTG